MGQQARDDRAMRALHEIEHDVATTTHSYYVAYMGQRTPFAVIIHKAILYLLDVYILRVAAEGC